jgi:hypothetical protein
MRTYERLKKHNQYHNNDNDDNVDSRFNDPAFNYFKQNDFCLVWSKQNTLTPALVTTDFVYLRLVGDRSIDDKNFGTIQKDRKLEMQKWSNILMI